MYGKIITPVLVIVIVMCLWHLQMDVSIKKFNTHLMHSFSTYFWVLILSDFYFTWCLITTKRSYNQKTSLIVCCPSSASRRDTKHWPKTWVCGHERFNENVGLKHILSCKVFIAPFFLTSFWSKYLFKYDRIKRNWLGTYT